MKLMTNIDDVRAEIMRLEGESVFNSAAWDAVLRALLSQGRMSGYEDACRRMHTAMDNATSFLPDPVLTGEYCGIDLGSGTDRTVESVITDLGMPGQRIELTLVPVAVETDR